MVKTFPTLDDRRRVAALAYRGAQQELARIVAAGQHLGVTPDEYLVDAIVAALNELDARLAVPIEPIGVVPDCIEALS